MKPEDNIRFEELLALHQSERQICLNLWAYYNAGAFAAGAISVTSPISVGGKSALTIGYLLHVFGHLLLLRRSIQSMNSIEKVLKIYKPLLSGHPKITSDLVPKLTPAVPSIIIHLLIDAMVLGIIWFGYQAI